VKQVKNTGSHSALTSTQHKYTLENTEGAIKNG